MNVDLRPPWLRRPWRFVLAGVVAVALLAVLEHSVHGLRAVGEPARGACWIWAEVPLDAPRPVAFLAVREFELATVPRQASLSAVADESFVMFLNGAYVGSGTYVPGAPLKRYRVEELLERGTNRLVVELRSDRTAGGFLAHLFAEGEGATDQPLVVTDAEWRIFRRDARREWRAGDPLIGGEPARVWRLPPTGRWRVGEPALELPIPFRSEGRARRLEAVRMRPLRSDVWRDLTRRRGDPQLGSKLVYDWGKVVEGFLFFQLPSTESPPALAWFGEEVPDPSTHAADEVLLFVPGQKSWRTRHPRRFRFLVLVGLEPASRPQVRLLDADTVRQLAAPSPPGGVFGVEPPVAWSATEMAVWQRLREQG